MLVDKFCPGDLVRIRWLAGPQGLIRRGEGTAVQLPDSQDSVIWVDDVPSSQHSTQPAEGMGSASEGRAAKRGLFSDCLADPVSQVRPASFFAQTRTVQTYVSLRIMSRD